MEPPEECSRSCSFFSSVAEKKRGQAHGVLLASGAGPGRTGERGTDCFLGPFISAVILRA